MNSTIPDEHWTTGWLPLGHFVSNPPPNMVVHKELNRAWGSDAESSRRELTMYAFANHPSPRPGFTFVADRESRRAGVVVVVISEHPGSMTALLRAAAEAAHRSAHLHVVDIGPAPGFEKSVIQAPEKVRDREHLSALTILKNPNVTIAHIDLTDRNDLVECCRSVGASLLVVDFEYFKDASGPGGALESLGDEHGVTCDLLIIQTSPSSR